MTQSRHAGFASGSATLVVTWDGSSGNSINPGVWRDCHKHENSPVICPLPSAAKGPIDIRSTAVKWELLNEALVRGTDCRCFCRQFYPCRFCCRFADQS